MRCRDQQGQSLPLALAMLWVLIGLVFLMVNTGRLLVKRERAQTAADLTAYSGGVDYARFLNLAGGLNKIHVVADVVCLIWDCFSIVNPLIVKMGDIMYGTGNLEKGDDKATYNLGVAPGLTLASTVMIGKANGIHAVPFWNQQKLTEVNRITPSFNLTRTQVSGLISEILRLFKDLKDDFSDAGDGEAWQRIGDSIPFMEFSDTSKNGDYSYKKRKSGKKVRVESKHVKEVRVKDTRSGRTRTQYVYTDPGSGKQKFVKRSKSESIPFTLGAVGPHSVTIWGYAPKDEKAVSALMPALPAVLAVAKVEVGGADLSVGNLARFDDYGVYFVPVDEDGMLGNFDLPDINIPRTGVDMIDSKLDRLEADYRAAKDKARSWLPEIQH